MKNKIQDLAAKIYNDVVGYRHPVSYTHLDVYKRQIVFNYIGFVAYFN